MQWSTMAATAVGTVLGVASTLIADHIRWRRDTSERDREALRTAFTGYLTALAQVRGAFSRTEPSAERVGKGHITLGAHGVYEAQQQLELMAQTPVVDMAGRATLSMLDFHDVVVTGHGSDSVEYLHAWRAAREARQALIDEMKMALQRT
ncbi:hypothetical protein ACH4OT_30895 [Streptomyces murinus]|uniref:hypothetical protein n=1 Tax=Streptomyces murinus TaxID=33900 RepID=UPI0037A740D3